MPLATGDVLSSRYRIVQLLGQGGMGAVYRAWDLNLKKTVALKENSDASPEARQQFEREATMLAHLSHPNLPRVTDHFFLSNQGQYLVMDYVEGEDLESMLDRLRRLPEDQALNWVVQVCDALAYLHNRPQPIIHRDIKPANIRITQDGRAVLVDFGISKVYDAEAKTTLGARAVTPGYSPPEQYGGGSTDARSDIYALGATLYHLLTGSAPPESVKRMVGETLTPPRLIEARISPTVEQAVLMAMALPTEGRFQNAAALKAALTTQPLSSDAGRMLVAAPLAVQSATASGGQRVNRGLIIGVVAALLLAVLAGWFLLANRGSTPSDDVEPGTGSAATEVAPDTPMAASLVTATTASTTTTIPTKTQSSSETAVPTVVDTVAPTATSPPPTATLLPTPFPSATLPPTPACAAVAAPFEGARSAAQERIGCAVGQPIGHSGAEERFELGMMFWRSDAIDAGQALVAFDNGTWRVFQHAPYVEGSPEYACTDANTPPQCPPTPRRGFGTMWCEVPAIRNGLGNAQECERGYSGSQQNFERGFMLNTDSGLFVFFDDGTWQRY
ncbi:serine/threonine protein kinase [Promineifilum sp.]|uniref:serine/threonine protein kinase n=1 Tax=Promineifilum sp. TaxID=2664178 RepID=UPI0035B49710